MAFATRWIRLCALALALGLGAACGGDGPLAPATDRGPRAAITGRAEFDVAFSAPNPCTGERVDFVGTQTVTTSETNARSGNTAFSVHVRSALEGRGVTTGLRYVARDVLNISVLFPDDGSGVRSNTFVSHANIISRSAADNWRLATFFHLTRTPDGRVATVIDRPPTSECRG